MVVIKQWSIYQMDIKNTFLHGELQKEIYMKQLFGFVTQRESNLAFKLCHSLHGLKQSLCVWFRRFNIIIQEFGMIQYESDHSIFYGHISLGKCIYLIVNVNVIVITNSDQNGIK